MGSEIIEIESIRAITNSDAEGEKLVVVVGLVLEIGGGVGGGFLGSLGETSV